MFAVFGHDVVDARYGSPCRRARRPAAYSPGGDRGRKQVLRADAWLPAARLSRAVWLAQCPDLAGPWHPFYVGGDETSRQGKDDHQPLRLQQPAAGVRLLSGLRHRRGGGSNRARRRWLGLERWIQSDAGGACGVPVAAGALWRRPRQPQGRSALGYQGIGGLRRPSRTRRDRSRESRRSGAVQARRIAFLRPRRPIGGAGPVRRASRGQGDGRRKLGGDRWRNSRPRHARPDPPPQRRRTCDAGRQRAGAELCERVVETGSLVLRHVGSDRRGEMSAQRFLASRDVTHQEILVTAGQRTASACAGRRIVAAQDTTEINFKDRDRARKGLGPAGDGQTPGFFCHAMVAIDAEDEALLGVVHARIWTRSSEPVTARRNRPIEQKESIRWIEATAVAGDRLGSAAQLIVLGDREFDIYEQFVRIPPGVELIVRAAQNRKLADDDDKLLFAAASDWREFGTMEVRVPPHRPGELARIARVGVKAGRVCIAKPCNRANSADPASVTLTLWKSTRSIRPKATIRSSGVCSPRCRFA